MVKKGAILFALMIMIGFGLIIYTPIAIFSVNLSTYDIIDEFNTYPYYSENSSEIQKLNLNVDVGNIEVKYITPPVDYLVKVDVNVELSGSILAGKSYEDFLNITLKLENINSTLDFTLEIISKDWFNPSIWSLQNVSIVVNIRKDVIIDIITMLEDGDFEIAFPYGVSIGNVHANVSTGKIFYDFKYCTIEGNITGNVNKGDIFYDFNHCTIEGNMTGIVNEGNIELTTLNAGYTHNNNWNFTIKNGNIKVYIYQYEDLGANITGIVRINNGEAYIHYDDDSPNNGAILEIPFGPGFINPYGFPLCVRSDEVCERVYGFDYTQISWFTPEGIVFFTSDDLLANIVKYYYHITFEIREGSFDMDLTSIP